MVSRDETIAISGETWVTHRVWNEEVHVLEVLDRSVGLRQPRPLEVADAPKIAKFHLQIVEDRLKFQPKILPGPLVPAARDDLEPRVDGLDGGALSQHALEERAADLVPDLQGTRSEERTSDKATAQRA